MGILGAVVLLAPPSESRRGTDRPAPAALARDGLAGAGGSPPIFLRSGAEIGPEQAFPGDVKDKGRPAGPAGFGTAAAPSPRTASARLVDRPRRFCSPPRDPDAKRTVPIGNVHRNIC